MSRSAVSLAAYWRLIQCNANFRRLWTAQIISELGDWVYVVAIYSLLLELTGRAESIAAAIIVQVLPQVFVAPTAGILNDRISRKKVMILADVVRAAIVLSMLLASRAGSASAIYALLGLETVMWAFFEPGRSSVLPNITGRGDLVVANSLSSITWSVNFALGSGLGGFLAAFLGRDVVFVLNGLSFLLSAWFLGRMRFEEPHLDNARPLRARELVDFSPMAAGLRYVANDRRLLTLLFAKAGMGLLGANWVILPIFGERIFPLRIGGVDPQRAGMLGMSALMSARGVGALLGPFVAGRWTGQDHRRQRVGILLGFLCGAAGYFALSFAPSIWVAAAMVIVAHAGGSMIWVFSTTLLQSYTEDRYRGRVFSADFAGMVVAMSVANFAAGQLVDAGWHVRTIAAGLGLLTLVPAALWGLGGAGFSLRRASARLKAR